MILPERVDSKRFFSEAQNSGLLTFDNFPRAVKHLPTKVMKCLSETASLSDGLEKDPEGPKIDTTLTSPFSCLLFFLLDFVFFFLSFFLFLFVLGPFLS